MSDSSTAAEAAALATFNTQLWTLYAFGVMFTVLRTYARIKAVGLRDLRADDYLIWFAILIYTTQSTLAYFAVNHGQGLANNAMTDAERLALDPNSVEYELRVFGSKIQVVGWTSYICLIFVLKICVLIFYIRLMEGLARNFKMRIWIGFGLVGATFVASILALYVSCHPFYDYWQISPDPGNNCQAAVARPIVWSTFTSSVITDIYLIMVPLPMLWGTKLRLAKKLAASFVLGAGIFVLICSLLKTVFVETDPIHGAQLAGEWGVRETFTSVVTTSLPMIFPLLKVWFKPFFGSALSSNKASSKNPTGFRTIGEGGGGSAGPGTMRSKPRRPDSLSLSESEENIVKGMKLQSMGGHKGIMVSRELKVVEDDISQNGSHHGENAKVIHEAW